MQRSQQRRRAQLAERIAGLPARTFAPFSTAEWISMDAYTETFTSCIGWPAPVHNDPPIVKEPPLVPPTIPVLVLGGDLDTLTPAFAGGRVVAQDMGPSARFVSVPNTTHVTALLDANRCASVIVRRFVAAPHDLQGLDTSCTSDIPEVRMVGAYPRVLRDAASAHAMPGNAAGAAGLRAATVATDTVGDALDRSAYLSVRHGTGLRGGSFTISDSGRSLTVHLDRAQWVSDAAMDGTGVWDRSARVVTATVSITTPDGVGRLTITWSTAEQRSQAAVRGTFDGQRVSAELPAP
jgi:hypothetical protein